MKYFFIIRKEGESGVPTFLNAVLAEEYNEENPMPPMCYDWQRKTPIGRKTPMPQELYLISKNKLLKADYLNHFGGFVISEELLELIENSNCKPFDKSKLKNIGWKGKDITNKQYYFIDFLFKDRLENIDYEKSLFAWDIGELKYDKKEIESLLTNELPKYIKGFKELSLFPTDYDVFQLRNSKAAHYLVCNESFKSKIIQNNLYGIDFIELPKVEDLYKVFYDYGEIHWNR